jgi:hypothetical protein
MILIKGSTIGAGAEITVIITILIIIAKANKIIIINKT